MNECGNILPPLVRINPFSFPPQVPSMDFMAMKRSQMYGMTNNPYSTPQQPGAGSYPSSQSYTSPPPHRYPISMPGRSQMGMSSMQYPQQQEQKVKSDASSSSVAALVLSAGLRKDTKRFPCLQKK
ncbi:hypothetical protein ILYODFUR_003056 [Ilyodon furcidens]|uniref:Uncharacterized protein n=1 Tax=Ilyodon furcidens TaxID=33524 RepID=A0ABV0SJ88_9TELE